MGMTERESWTVSALARELGRDRRTVAQALALAGVKPIGQGPKGPMFPLGEAVLALYEEPPTHPGDAVLAAARQLEAVIASAALPSRTLRALRNALAHVTWEAFAGWGAPPAPAWPLLSAPAFARAYEALLGDGDLETIAELAADSAPTKRWAAS